MSGFCVKNDLDLLENRNQCLFRNEKHSYRKSDYFRNPVITYLEVPSRFPLQKRITGSSAYRWRSSVYPTGAPQGTVLPSDSRASLGNKYRWGQLSDSGSSGLFELSAAQN